MTKDERKAVRVALALGALLAVLTLLVMVAPAIGLAIGS